MKTSEILPLARMFDEAGYDGMVCSDHMIYPRKLSSPYPDSSTGKPGWPPETAWPDCWVQIGAMAAVTSRLRFSNAVYIAPARPLLEVAKQGPNDADAFNAVLTALFVPFGATGGSTLDLP